MMQDEVAAAHGSRSVDPDLLIILCKHTCVCVHLLGIQDMLGPLDEDFQAAAVMKLMSPLACKHWRLLASGSAKPECTLPYKKPVSLLLSFWRHHSRLGSQCIYVFAPCHVCHVELVEYRFYYPLALRLSGVFACILRA